MLDQGVEVREMEAAARVIATLRSVMSGKGWNSPLVNLPARLRDQPYAEHSRSSLGPIQRSLVY